MSFTEGSHWYTATGEACHTLPNVSKGGTRLVRITDARKLGLYPSTTTILKKLDKPGLNQWKMEQVAMAALTMDHTNNVIDDAYIAKVIDDALKQVGDAANIGGEIHKAMELHFQNLPYDPKWRPQVLAVEEFIEEHGIIFTAHELRLVNHEYGFAGTTDKAITCKMRGLGILDFKTKDTKPGKEVKGYPEQAMQIASYHVTHYHSIPDPSSFACGCNLFVSRNEILPNGLARLDATWWSAEDLNRAFKKFALLCEYWRLDADYDPRISATKTKN